MAGRIAGIIDRNFNDAFRALDHAVKAMRKSGYAYIELGWNLEDNEEINQLETHLGAKPGKRYRIYRKLF